MKIKSIIFALAIAGSFFASCSPQSIDDINAEQNIDKDSIIVPTHG